MALYREYFTATPSTTIAVSFYCCAPTSFPILDIILNYYSAYGSVLLLENVVERPRNTLARSTQESVKRCFRKLRNR